MIAPGQDKGKSYIEHTAAKAGTSYKARLKAAIDRLIPACKDLEDLLSRLQREGYEIKRGCDSFLTEKVRHGAVRKRGENQRLCRTDNPIGGMMG